MSYIVDFNEVSITGLESSPHAQALAGLRANEARYFKNKYNYNFTTDPAGDNASIVNYVNTVLAERDITIQSKPLEVSNFIADGIRWTYVFYESGLSINVMYSLEDTKKRAVGLSCVTVWMYQRS